MHALKYGLQDFFYSNKRFVADNFEMVELLYNEGNEVRCLEKP